MLNPLGTHNGKARFEGDREFTDLPEGFLHLYVKEDSRIGRKMGHFTLLGDNQHGLLNKLEALLAIRMLALNQHEKELTK